MNKLILLLFFPLISSAQVHEWTTFHSGTGGFVNSKGNILYSNDSNFVYSVGDFSGTADFDPGPGVDSRTAVDQEDIFVQKYHSNGTLIWTQTFGGSGRESAPGFCVRNDEIYIAGSWYGTVDFDPGAGTSSFTFVGGAPYAAIGYGSSLYLLKLDTSGVFQWVHAFGSGESHRGIRQVCVDSAGDVYTVATVHDRTGSASPLFDIDPTAGTDDFTHSNYSGIVQKFDSDGNYIFGLKFNGTTSGSYPSEVFIEDAILDSDDNLIVCGHYNGNIDFDPTAGVNIITSVSEYDPFMMKINSAGTVQWMNHTGTTGSNNWSMYTDIVTDGSGNIFVSAFIRDTMDLDPGAGTFTVDASSLSAAATLTKFDSDGNFLMANSWDMDTSDYGLDINDIAFNANNNHVFVAGVFADTVDLDPGTGTALVFSAGDYNTCVIELDLSGNFLQGFAIGDTNYIVPSCVFPDSSDALYLSGYFDGDIDFDPTGVTSLVSSASDYVTFIARYDVELMLSIPEISSEGILNVYPNPSEIELNIFINGEILKLDVLDANGHTVQLSMEINGSSATADVSSLPAGMYYVRVNTEVGTAVKRFVKVN